MRSRARGLGPEHGWRAPRTRIRHGAPPIRGSHRAPGRAPAPSRSAGSRPAVVPRDDRSVERPRSSFGDTSALAPTQAPPPVNLGRDGGHPGTAAEPAHWQSALGAVEATSAGSSQGGHLWGGGEATRAWQARSKGTKVDLWSRGNADPPFAASIPAASREVGANPGRDGLGRWRRSRHVGERREPLSPCSRAGSRSGRSR
jgi:hypothetical protein